jgi:hypothetical protein
MRRQWWRLRSVHGLQKVLRGLALPKCLAGWSRIGVLAALLSRRPGIASRCESPWPYRLARLRETLSAEELQLDRWHCAITLVCIELDERPWHRPESCC